MKRIYNVTRIRARIYLIEDSGHQQKFELHLKMNTNGKEVRRSKVSYLIPNGRGDEPGVEN